MLRRRFLNLLNYHNYTFETFNVSVGLRFGNVHNRSCEKLLFYKHKHTLLINKNQYETNKIQEDKVYNSFTYRTHTCGELRAKHNGEKVTLCGWVQYLRLSKFLLLRDSYGMVQCIVKNTNVNFNDIPIESVVLIDGLVALRPPNMVNSKMNTGEIEIVIDNLKILNIASKLPFNLRDHQKPKEQLRLQHRYVDLRFPEMQNNLRNRSSMLHNMRKFLVEENCFVEIETPTLFCRTPGGAREFVVPTHHPGLFYSLVQSPQQFKQMLMVGGIDRYFQVARCYRDEATRPDRQPEFTQLDIEMSFTNLDNVISLIEQLLYKTFTKQLPNPPFRRMTYNYAIENYGTDKPNLTYDLQLQNISFLFNEGDKTDVSTFVLPYPIEVGKLPAKHKEKIKALKQKYNVRIIFDEYIIKELTSEIRNNIQSIVGEKSLLICMGDKKNVCCCLGDIRQLLGSILQSTGMIKMNECIEPLWVVDFPLFVKGENGLETCHHPFTAPHPSDLHILETDPLNVRSLAYDIVMNGNEIGGGSVRVHDAELQEKLLQLLNIDKFKLAHFIHALRSGCPPHAGIALGIDRLVTLACGADSIRDVIAFPKSHEGKDPLSGAPNVITEDDKNYYHINVTK